MEEEFATGGEIGEGEGERGAPRLFPPFVEPRARLFKRDSTSGLISVARLLREIADCSLRSFNLR